MKARRRRFQRGAPIVTGYACWDEALCEGELSSSVLLLPSSNIPETKNHGKLTPGFCFVRKFAQTQPIQARVGHAHFLLTDTSRLSWRLICFSCTWFLSASDVQTAMCGCPGTPLSEGIATICQGVNRVRSLNCTYPKCRVKCTPFTIPCRPHYKPSLSQACGSSIFMSQPAGRHFRRIRMFGHAFALLYL